MTDPSKTSCCSARAFKDAITVLPQQVVVGHAVRCQNCRRLIGQVKILYTAPKDLAKAWTGTSEALLTDFVVKRRESPLWFKLVSGVLVPEGTAVQQDLTEEAF